MRTIAVPQTRKYFKRLVEYINASVPASDPKRQALITYSKRMSGRVYSLAGRGTSALKLRILYVESPTFKDESAALRDRSAIVRMPVDTALVASWFGLLAASIADSRASRLKRR